MRGPCAGHARAMRGRCELGPTRGEGARLSEPRRELAHHLGIDLALEGNDETRHLPSRHPAPGLELGLASAARGHVDFLLKPRETHGKPLLPLTAIAALEGDA